MSQDRCVIIPTAAEIHRRRALLAKPVFSIQGVAHPKDLPPHLRHLAFGFPDEEKDLWDWEDIGECVDYVLERRRKTEAQFGKKKTLSEIN